MGSWEFRRNKMQLIYNKIFLKHKTENHPECPERLAYFDKNIKEVKLENGEKYLNLIYDKSHIDSIKNASKSEKSVNNPQSDRLSDNY